MSMTKTFLILSLWQPPTVKMYLLRVTYAVQNLP